MVDYRRDGLRVQKYRPMAIGFIDGTVAVDKFLFGSGTAQIVDFDSDTTLDASAYDWTLSINGIEYSFTSDSSPTQTEIATGMAAAVNAGSEPVTASVVSDKCRVTADVPGRPFTWVDLASTDSTAVPVTTEVTPNAADGVKAPISGKLTAAALQAQTAPTTSDLLVLLRNITRGLEAVVTLTDGASFERDESPDIFVGVDDLVFGVVTQVGSGTAGAGLGITVYQEVEL